MIIELAFKKNAIFSLKIGEKRQKYNNNGPQVELCMQDWEQADDTSNRILTSPSDPTTGNSIEATKFKVLQLICRRGQVCRLPWGNCLLIF
jgi:hypothetical protein